MKALLNKSTLAWAFMFLGSGAWAQADGCVISKMDAHRKAIGEDALITAAQIGEWEEECRAGG